MKVQQCADLPVESDPQGRSTLQLQVALQEILSSLGQDAPGVDLSQQPQALTSSLRFNIEAMHAELAELLDHLPWKSWKEYPPNHLDETRLQEIRYEAIDLAHFLNNMFIALGMDDQMVEDMYWAKHKENILRQWGRYGNPSIPVPEAYR